MAPTLCVRRRTAVLTAVARATWVTWARAACLLTALGLLACSEPTTEVSVEITGVPDTAVGLRVRALLGGAPNKVEPPTIRKPPATELSHFRATLAPGDTGKLQLEAVALDQSECAVAVGFTDLQISGPGSYSATMALGEEVGCSLFVRKVGEGAGRVRVVNGDQETALEFDRPPMEMPTCPLQADYPLEQTLVLPLRTRVRVTADTLDDALNGSVFGSWGESCNGRGPCELEISERRLTINVTFLSTQLCSSSGICWRHPLPQGTSLRRITGRSAVDVWAVGDRGTYLHWNGTYWSTPRRPYDTGALSSLWLAPNPSDAVIAVGEQGLVRTLSQQQWACPERIGSRGLNDVWGLSGSDAWAVGDQGLILHWDGKAWTQQPVPAGVTTNLYGVLGTMKAVWAVGESGTLLRSDGSSWTRIPLPTTATLLALWIGPDEELWAVGDSGTIVQVKGGAARVVTAPTTSRLYGIWGLGTSELWAVGAFGTVLRYQGTSWVGASSGTSADLFAVWGATTDDVWAVGVGGVLLRWNGLFWSPQSAARTTETLNGLWSRSMLPGQASSANSALLAVGDRGTLLRWNGSDWGLVVAPGTLTTRSLRAAWGPSADDAWAVGDGGTAVRWSGGQAVLYATGTTSDLHALWGQSASDLYAVGQGGTLARYDGTRWTAATLPAALGGTLRAIWGTSRNDLWMAGDGGILLRWNGTTATAVPSGTVRNLRALWGTGPAEIWAIGDGGTLLRFNGASWSPHPQSGQLTQNNLLAIWGLSSTRIWAAGERGTLLNLRNGAWEISDSNTVADLRAVGLVGAAEVTFAGQSGSILVTVPML